MMAPSYVSAVRSATHEPASFIGSSYIGLDSNSSSRHFMGAVDEVRIYNSALTRTQIERIRDGGQAESPMPFDQATQIVKPILTWVGAAQATAHHLYLGLDPDAVAGATPESSEYLGAVTTPRYVIKNMQPLTTYYWRIDEQSDTGTVPGSVWSFTTAEEIGSGAWAHWKFNEGSGSTAYDSSGNNSHGAITGAAWTTGKQDKALYFDGNDKIEFGTGPALKRSDRFHPERLDQNHRHPLPA